MTLSLSVRSSVRVLQVLLTAILVLTVLSLIGSYAKWELGHPRLLGFVPEFQLDAERNIPTYFSGLLLLGGAGLLFLVARLVGEQQGRFRRHWTALGGIFVYLSVDEITSLHERLIEPGRAFLEGAGASGYVGGVFYFAWVVPAIALLLIFALSYVRFFWHLPRRWQGLFAVAGIIYVGGALGLELVGGWYFVQAGGGSLFTSLLATLEEVMEMSGMALFVYALLEYLRAHLSGVYIALHEGREAAEGAARRRGAEEQNGRAVDHNTFPSTSV